MTTWRRLLSTTGVCCALFFALLAWRVSAGADPALSAAGAQPAVTQTSGPGGGVTGATSSGDAATDAMAPEDGVAADGSATPSSTPTTQAS